jgi:NifU-like protein involved in Fe-S cluster formation
MSGDSDLIKLYSARILELAADLPHTDPLAQPQATAKKRSPLCGSTVTVDLVVNDGKISEYAQDVKACALGQAAASVVGSAIIGATAEQIETARAELHAMLKDGAPAPSAPFQDLEVLTPARDFKNRHASILLSLDATLAALDHIKQDA